MGPVALLQGCLGEGQWHRAALAQARGKQTVGLKAGVCQTVQRKGPGTKEFMEYDQKGNELMTCVPT